MTAALKDEAPVYFATAAAFRAWLIENSASASVLFVGFYRVGSGRPSITWPESVDEALCFGWIDGVRKRINDEAYKIRFTPRRKGSIWSSVNIGRATALIAEGRMRPPGLKAYERRTERKSRVYSYEQLGVLNLTPHELKAFKKNKSAWKHFEAEAPGYRKTALCWVASAKQEAARARRLAKLIQSCAAGARLLP